ncbi:hypothetical protein GCM10025879_03280 [Leuconostoc litchii]|nr:hypothetical protein GCM10025879_03280 [Leuconostoc litchii]
MEAFRESIKKTISSSQVDINQGLTTEQVSKSREQNGSNIFTAEKKHHC